MERHIDILKTNSLFERISREELSSILSCLGAFTKAYEKKEIILYNGDPTYYIGIVVAGSVKVIKEDDHAYETMLAEVQAGDTFGEVFACGDVYCSPVTVMAQERCEVMYLDYKKMIKTCSNACIFHTKLTENLLKVIAQKCLFLNQRLEILSQRTTREKIFSYLRMESKGRKKFEVGLNREEMANFLCVDRSAMSAELSKMQREGMIRYQKRGFELL